MILCTIACGVYIVDCRLTGAQCTYSQALYWSVWKTFNPRIFVTLASENMLIDWFRDIWPYMLILTQARSANVMGPCTPSRRLATIKYRLFVCSSWQTESLTTGEIFVAYMAVRTCASYMCKYNIFFWRMGFIVHICHMYMYIHGAVHDKRTCHAREHAQSASSNLQVYCLFDVALHIVFLITKTIHLRMILKWYLKSENMIESRYLPLKTSAERSWLSTGLMMLYVWLSVVSTCFFVLVVSSWLCDSLQLNSFLFHFNPFPANLYTFSTKINLYWLVTYFFYRMQLILWQLLVIHGRGLIV